MVVNAEAVSERLIFADSRKNVFKCVVLNFDLKFYLFKYNYSQEEMMMQMKMRHDQNLTEISLQLFKLQSSLMTKERYLGQLITEREQVRMWVSCK